MILAVPLLAVIEIVCASVPGLGPAAETQSKQGIRSDPGDDFFLIGGFFELAQPTG